MATKSKVLFDATNDLSLLKNLAGEMVLSNEKLPTAARNRAPGDPPDVRTVLHNTSLDTLKDYDKRLKLKVTEMETGNDDYVESASTNPHLGRHKKWQQLVNLTIKYKLWLAQEAEIAEEKTQLKEELESEYKQLQALELSQNSDARVARMKALEERLASLSS